MKLGSWACRWGGRGRRASSGCRCKRMDWVQGMDADGAAKAHKGKQSTTGWLGGHGLGARAWMLMAEAQAVDNVLPIRLVGKHQEGNGMMVGLMFLKRLFLGKGSRPRRRYYVA
eukprot:1154180-Pelagomonas_calceolata.AAC.2